MTCAIMQPTFIPWAGYFNLIAQSSVFIFLDNVQLSKQSWQVRNNILLHGRQCWLTLPTRRLTLSQKIMDVELHNKSSWKRKQLTTLEHSYSKKPHGKAVLRLMKHIFSKPLTNLADQNILIIKSFSKKLGLSPKFVRASEISIDGQRSEKLLQMCSYFNCKTYISPQGAKKYIDEDGVFENSPIKLVYQDYYPTPYDQGNSGSFVSHLSIVDVVANIGFEETKKYIHQGEASLLVGS
jgi:hypothetical protein